MKRLKLLFILQYCISCAIYSQSLEDRDKKIIKRNNIKTKIQMDFSFEKGKQSEQGKKISVTTYTKSGDVLEENTLDNKEQVIGWEKYQYNETGNRVFYERTSGVNKYNKTYKYDANNNVVQESGFNGAENFKNNITYDSKGKPVEIIYSINDHLDERRIYEYTGTVSIISIYKTGNVLSSKLKLVYDEKGNIIEETMYSMDNKELEKKILSYDNASRQIAEEKIKGGIFFYKLTNTYNYKGNILTVSEENTTDKKFVKKSYDYDANDNLTEYHWRRNPNDDFNVKTYTYDSHGICQTEHTFYPSTKFELLTKYEYEFY
jgi:hypothetical protein